jgi:ATP-dependent exoDNAse (exonuclease V) beta subunit
MNLPTLPDFSHIIKDEATHTYTTTDGQVLRNVTGIIATLEEPFNADYWAPIKAAERGTTAEALKAEWEKSSQDALARGTQFHEQLHHRLTGQAIEAPLLPEIEAFDYWWAIHQEMNGLQLLKAEWVIGDATLGVAGTLDALFVDKQGDLVLYDWKSGKKFYSASRYTLLEPFSDVGKCELHKYSLQVSLYRLLLRRAGLPHVRAGRIVHFRPDATPWAYNVVDYTDRLEAWLTQQPEALGS